MQKFKVLIGQRSPEVIKKIKEVVAQEKLHTLEIEYVHKRIGDLQRKMYDWNPDVVITGQIYDDSRLVGEYGTNMQMHAGCLDRNGKFKTEVYLFSMEEVKDKYRFTGIIEKDYEEIRKFLKKLPSVLKKKYKHTEAAKILTS